MYKETVSAIAEVSTAKVAFLGRTLFGYLAASMLAGAYVGMGIALVFSVGAPLAEAGSPLLKALMGASFGVALTLVVLAGAELFTGNNLIMATGWLMKKTTARDVARIWLWSWTGNLLGALLLALMITRSGALLPAAELLDSVAAKKMTDPAMRLFFSAVLCNWLVCLAVWTAMRTKSDAAKCIVIFWCLFAFIACGYEHSVANMTLLPLALFGPHGEMVTWAGLARNLCWVSLGNVVGGTIMVAGAYWLAATHGENRQPTQ